MIPVRYLEALEKEEFERLPVAPYRRSFLREYARYLGLDADALASEYELRYETPDPAPVQVSPGLGHRFDSALAALTPGRLVGIVLVLGIGLAVWLLGSSGGTNQGSTSRQIRPTRPAAVAAAPPLKTPKVVTRARRGSAPPTLTLTLLAARGPCWVLVQLGSASGRTVYVHTLEPGERLHFGLRAPLWIRVGAPWNLDASIGGRSVTSSLPLRTGDMIANRDGLKPTP